MESRSISKKLKTELMKKSRSIEDNSDRILFILRNFGPQRFTSIIKYSELSRSTVNNHLAKLRNQNNVEKRLIIDKKTNREYQHYVITEKGKEKLGEKPLKLKDEVYVINELKNNVKKLENLIEFYKDIGVEDRFIIHIVRIVSKIGENFFKLQQDRDLYLSLFYIFYNSILGQGALASKYWRYDLPTTQKFSGYKLNLDQFCELFQVSSEAINYLAKEKLIKSEFGFYLIRREKNDFFFHEEDLLGTTTIRLINDRLIDEILNLQEKLYEEFSDIDQIAEEITNHLENMGLIWATIKNQFNLLVLNLLIKNAIEMGFLDIERERLMEGIIQSRNLQLTDEGKKLREFIIEGTRTDLNLNVITLVSNN